MTQWRSSIGSTATISSSGAPLIRSRWVVGEDSSGSCWVMTSCKERAILVTPLVTPHSPLIEASSRFRRLSFGDSKVATLFPLGLVLAFLASLSVDVTDLASLRPINFLFFV
jgi:hypothetical protein